MQLSKQPFNDDQLDFALYELIREIEVKEVRDLEDGEVN